MRTAAAPEVHWRAGEAEEQALRRTYELIGAELDASGIATLEARLPQQLGERFRGITHHHMGTTRMHRDPRHGVVDENSRVHGIANLFVAGSSVFPTGGATTATLTLVALTIRLADHLRQELASKDSSKARPRRTLVRGSRSSRARQPHPAAPHFSLHPRSRYAPI